MKLSLSVILLSFASVLFAQQQQKKMLVLQPESFAQQNRRSPSIPAGIHYNNFYPFNVNFPIADVTSLR